MATTKTNTQLFFSKRSLLNLFAFINPQGNNPLVTIDSVLFVQMGQKKYSKKYCLKHQRSELWYFV